MFLLSPAYKDYLWGGDRLRAAFGKQSPDAIIAESWELSVHPDGRSVIASGACRGETLAAYLVRHPGAAGEAAGDFPVLVKLIDAQRALSVQVHPDDAYALRHAHERGKTELWHILDAAPGAFLYLGVSRPVSREELAARIADGTVEQVLQKVPVRAGESYYVPAGMLHAIGAGILLYEVQETSNQTYRVYDYGRVDAAGRPRQLHVQQALAVASLSPVSAVPPGADAARPCGGGTLETLAETPFFTLRLLSLDGTATLDAAPDGFLHLLCVDGAAEAADGGERLPLPKGAGLFACAMERVQLQGCARVLCVSRGIPAA